MLAIPTFVIILIVFAPSVYVVINLFKFYLDHKRRVTLINKFPGSDPHPIWGHLHEFPGPNEEGLIWMHEAAKDYSPRGPAKIWYGPIVPSVHVFHPSSVKTILKQSEPKPTTFGAYRFAAPWLGDGLLLASGKKWSRNRRLLTPGFHFDILKPYVEISNRCTDILLSKFDSFSKNDEYFEVFTHISLITLDIILRCAFSYDNDCQLKGDQHPYVCAVKELAGAMVYRALRPWMYPDFIFFYFTKTGRDYRKKCDYVHSISEDIIKKRKESLQKYGNSILRTSKYVDFLDILLMAKDTDGKGLTDLDIRNEVDTFLFEGHDTTASAISWTLHSLAEHPDIQKKCQQEIDDILKGRDSDDIEWEDLNNLPYLTMCIKESLRLHCPVPFIERQTTKDIDLDGYTLPANSLVGVNIYVLHHNTLVWDEPFEFRPERFTSDKIEKMDPYAFVPFSAGPRNCIGQNFAMHELKIVLARILRRYDLELDPVRKTKHEMMVVMKTESGMYMKVKKRS